MRLSEAKAFQNADCKCKHLTEIVHDSFSHSVSSNTGDGRVVRWNRVNFQCRGVLLIWIRVRQGPTAFGVGVWTFFLSSIILSLFFFPLFERWPDIE